MDALPRVTEIFAKTQSGTNALTLPRSALSFSARQLLILIDGRRDLADLATIFDERSLERSLGELREHGYIEAVPRPPAPAPLPLPTPLPLSAPDHEPPPPRSVPRNRVAIVVGLLLGVTAAVWVLLLRNVDTTSSRPLLAASVSAPAPSSAQAENATASAQAPGAGASAPAGSPAPAAATSPPPAPAAPTVAATSAPAAKPKQGLSYTAADEATEALRRQNASTQAAATQPSNPPSAAGAPAPGTLALVPPAPSAPQQPAATVASASPSAPPAAPTAPAIAPPPAASSSGSLHVRTQVAPQMPQKAKDLGIDSGRVVVVLHVDPKGAVERVELVSAVPPEVYDKAMEQAFAQWTFEPLGIPGRMTIEVEIRPQQN